MIILAHKYGQLGNRLAYMKAFLALAIEYDLKIISFSFDEYAGFFSGSSQSLLCGYPPRRGLFSFSRVLSRVFFLIIRQLPKVLCGLGPHLGLVVVRPDINGHHLFTAGDIDCMRQRKALIFLSGWPCVRPDILEKHAEKIREYFRLTDDCRSNIDSLIAEARAAGDFLVGIHLRQGDYRVWENGKYYFETSLYLDLMQMIVDKYRDGKVVFIVCTNEPQDWKLFENFTYFLGPGDAVGDMYSLAECDEIYGPQSSFSAWAAFYGKRPLFCLESRESFSAKVSVVNQQN